MPSPSEGPIKSSTDFPNNSKGWQDRWTQEITAAKRNFETFHKQSEEVVDRYTDAREKQKDVSIESRVNKFWSNTQTMESVLYSNLPRCTVKRDFDDNNDDVGRVASLIMERALTQDISRNGEEYNTVLQQVVQDRLTSGLGTARLYYEADMDDETEELLSESVTVGYVFWGDVLWPWSRSWAELPWLAFRSYLTREEMKKRFGDKSVENAKFTVQTPEVNKGKGNTASDEKGLWEKAEIWEIWDRETEQVFWYTEGRTNILDKKDDPLNLKSFFPCPKFWMANTTTSYLMPRADFVLMQDLYNEIDTLHTRISILTEAVRVVGVYDQSNEGIQRMLEEGTDNELIPVDNWAMFAEKGGVAGVVDWFPIEQVVEAIVNLRQLREDNIALLDDVSGMSDIVRGSGTHPREGVGTQEMKAEFGSVRIQKLENELAQFVTDILEIKAEIMSKHFEPPTILSMANAQYFQMTDMELIEPAVKLIQDWDLMGLRVNVKAESMALVDYARVRQERGDYIKNMAMFLQSSAPILEYAPEAAPTLLEMLKWGMAGYRGSNEIEGILDKAIEQATKAPPKGQDDGEQQKAQAELQKEKLKGQNELQKIQAKFKADMQLIQAKMVAKLREIQASAQSDASKEQLQAQANAAEEEMSALFNARLEQLKHDLKMEEISEQNKIRSEENAGRDSQAN